MKSTDVAALPCEDILEPPGTRSRAIPGLRMGLLEG